MGHGKLRIQTEKNRPKKLCVAMKFSDNWAVCIIRWSISNQKDINWSNGRRVRLRTISSNLFRSWLIFAHSTLTADRYLQQRIRDDYDEIVCRNVPHIEATGKKPRLKCICQRYWVSMTRNIFTNNFTRKSLSFRFIELFAWDAILRGFFNSMLLDAVFKVEDLLVYNWNQRGNIVVAGFETLMNISTGWPNV